MCMCVCCAHVYVLPKTLIYFHLDRNDLGVIYISYVSTTSGSGTVRQDTNTDPFIKPYFSSPYQTSPALQCTMWTSFTPPDGTWRKEWWREREKERAQERFQRTICVKDSKLSLHSAAHSCVSLQRCASGETWNKPSIHPHLPLHSYSPSLVPPHGLSVLCTFSSPAGWRRRVRSGRVFNHFNYVLMQSTSPPR